MVEVTSGLRCRKPECEIAKTGACAEGHVPPGACPFFGKQVDDGFIDNDEEAGIDLLEGVTDEGRVALPTGELLAPEDVDRFLRWRGATLVTIVGERDSGKTTLICSIYERFLKGSYADHLFAGSWTLVGLEKRSHHARAESGRAQPDTPRTPISEGLRFAHLGFMKIGRESRRADLMLSDRAGEVYGRARSNSALVPELIEVFKADRLVLLLDGARVASAVNRAGAVQAVRQTLRSFIDGQGLCRTSRVQVVLTKIDLLARHAEKAAVDEMLSKFIDCLKADFAPRLAELSFWEVAARDPLGEFPVAHGIEPLFRDWVTPRPPVVQRSKSTAPVVAEFDRLLLRTSLEIVP